MRIENKIYKQFSSISKAVNVSFGVFIIAVFSGVTAFNAEARPRGEQIKELTCKCTCKTAGGEKDQNIKMPSGGCNQIFGASCTDKFGAEGKIKRGSCSKEVKVTSILQRLEAPAATTNAIE